MLVAALSECLPSSQYKPYTPEGSVMLLIIHLVFSIDVSHKVYTVGQMNLLKQYINPVTANYFITTSAINCCKHLNWLVCLPRAFFFLNFDVPRWLLD